MPLECFSRTLALVASLTAALVACGSSGGEQPPVVVVNLPNDGAGVGCIQSSFPVDQPDISPLSPPRFLLTTFAAQRSTVGQAIVNPGDEIEAEITVNGPTRKVIVELSDAWSPQRVIFKDEFDTLGNEIIPVLLSSSEGVRGRFYMRLTLCGIDCDERNVIFDINQDINSPYERTVIEGRDIVQVDNTCIDLGPRPGIGSGTIVIQ
jgi:hypothetical protein